MRAGRERRHRRSGTTQLLAGAEEWEGDDLFRAVAEYEAERGVAAVAVGEDGRRHDDPRLGALHLLRGEVDGLHADDADLRLRGLDRLDAEGGIARGLVVD